MKENEKRFLTVEGNNDSAGNMPGQNSAVTELRQRAEKALANLIDIRPDNLSKLSPEQSSKMIRDLRLHQIELQLQNDDLRQAQRELSASKERYFDLYDLAPMAYCILSEKGIIFEGNLSFAGLLGVTRKGFTSQPISKYIYSEDQESFTQHCRLLFSTSEAQTIELRLNQNDGPFIWVQMTVTIATDADGAPCCRVMLSDISSRKQEEAEQAKLKRALISLTQALDDFAMVAITDLEGKIIYVNEQFCTVSKYSSRELLGHNYEILDSDLHPKEFMDDLWATISSGQVWRGDVRNRAKDGSFYWVATTIVPFFDENKKLESYVSIHVDISKQKQQAQVAIHASRRESMAKMSAGIAHEINNLNAIITGSVNLLAKFIDDPKKFANKVDTIQEASGRIANILKSLTKYTRAANGPVSIQQHRLSQIVSDAIVFYGRAITNQFGVDLRVDLNNDAMILCDEAEIEHVLVNLISNAVNAVKDLKDKWVKIEIAEELNFVVLRVIDSGEGIPKNIRAKIFEPFFTTKRSGAGLGLGLSIAKGILEEQKASIEVNPNNKNTCFEIRFQRSRVH